jgi:hypothetical protein
MIFRLHHRRGSRTAGGDDAIHGLQVTLLDELLQLHGGRQRELDPASADANGTNSRQLDARNRPGGCADDGARKRPVPGPSSTTTGLSVGISRISGHRFRACGHRADRKGLRGNLLAISKCSRRLSDMFSLSIPHLIL